MKRTSNSFAVHWLVHYVQLWQVMTFLMHRLCLSLGGCELQQLHQNGFTLREHNSTLDSSVTAQVLNQIVFSVPSDARSKNKVLMFCVTASRARTTHWCGCWLFCGAVVLCSRSLNNREPCDSSPKCQVFQFVEVCVCLCLEELIKGHVFVWPRCDRIPFNLLTSPTERTKMWSCRVLYSINF